MELVTSFPPSELENLPVWRHVLLRALSTDARHRVETDIISLTQNALSEWQSGGYKLGQVNKVVRVITKMHPSLQKEKIKQSKPFSLDRSINS